MFLRLGEHNAEELASLRIVDERTTARLGTVRLWRATKRSAHRRLYCYLSAFENVCVWIHEGKQILDGDHYLAVLELEKPSREVARMLVFASLTGADPIWIEWPDAGLLVVGSYQTVYAFDSENLKLRSLIICPEGPEIQQICLASYKLAPQCLLIISEYVVRKMSSAGAVEWVISFDDVVTITSIEGERINCEPRVRSGTDDKRYWVVDLLTGQLIAP